MVGRNRAEGELLNPAASARTCPLLGIDGIPGTVYHPSRLSKSPVPPNPRKDPVPSGRITGSECQRRLDVFETPSGGRTISVAVVATLAEPKALEPFIPPGEGPILTCRACHPPIELAAPFRSRLNRDRAPDGDDSLRRCLVVQ